MTFLNNDIFWSAMVKRILNNGIFKSIIDLGVNIGTF